MAKSKKKNHQPKQQIPLARSTPPWLTNHRLHRWMLFALSILLYVNTLSHDYALDDAIVIYDNMFTTEGVRGISGILTNDTFYGFFKEEGKANLVAGGRYRPLSLITFALEVQVFGLKPWVGHLVNTLLYGGLVVLLYVLLLRCFRPRFPIAQASFLALAASLLFAAHPLHTEVVANIKGRDELLSLLGSLAALYYALRAYHEKQPKLQVAVALCFFLALLAKENAITFLAIAPLTFYFFTKAKTGTLVRQLAPFAAAAVVFLLIRFSVVGFSLGHTPLELMNNPFLKIENNQWVPFTWAEKSATIVYTLGKYVQLLVFPYPLTHDYYPKHIHLLSWSNLQVLGSLLLYIGLIGIALRGWARKTPLSYGILYYLITLSIVSNIVFPVGTNMSERLIFMPSVGFAIAVAAAAWWLVDRKKVKLPTIMGGVGIVVVILGIQTMLRNVAWKDNYTLFTTDIQTAPNSAKLRNAVGGELIATATQGTNETEKQNRLNEAVGHLQEATRLHPTYKNAYLLLGNAYNYLQQYEASIRAYEQALRLDPNYTEATNNLGITYRNAGKFYGEQQGDLEKSLQYLRKAYELRPLEYETVRLLGVAYGIRGNTAQAINFFTKATELEPGSADAWFNLGVAYQRGGQLEDGSVYIQKAEELEPGITERRRTGG